MKTANMRNKAFFVMYRFLLPLFTLGLYIGIASFIRRSLLFNSWLIDILARLVVCFWFTGLYVKLTKLSAFSFYPNKKWTNNDVIGFEKWIYIGLCLFFYFGK